MGQREIPTKRAETTGFRPFLEQLLADYGKTGLLEVKSGGNDMFDSNVNAVALVVIDAFCVGNGNRGGLFPSP